jgi:eukaryotic-like serine/threonine-protein kinase
VASRSWSGASFAAARQVRYECGHPVSACAVVKSRVESSWACKPGQELVPGSWAWALLGDGRRCETWLAWSRLRWGPVAIKLPRPDQVNERSRQALAREADAVLPLAHPSIQRLLEVRLDARVPHLVFEYVEGPTLASLLDDRGALPPRDVVRLGLQIGSALHYLHELGIGHLDLKPQNIAVRDGRAVLLDFDLAQRFGARESESRPESSRRPRGSPPYMAPEQVRRAPASPRMDLFGLGATLYEAATNRVAFDPGDSPDGPDYPQLAGSPPPVRSFNPRVPVALDRAISALLASRPSDRPRNALAAMALLATALPRGQMRLWPEWVSIARLAAS